jgi:catechol 2,3-dioxygenase-like lactoylglutathione lyase family enzyme
MRIRISLAMLALAAAAVPEEPKRPPITGVAHISLFAHDIEKSRHFYKDWLGFGEPFQLNKPDGSLALTFIKVNDRQFIELNPENAEGTDRLNHISVETPDARAMRLYLASRGVKVPDQVPTGRIGNANFNVKDPDGHPVEIVQYLPAGWTVRERGKHLGPTRISDRMAHIGITVANLDAATKFYTGILGFHEIWRGSKDGKVLNWVNSQVPEGEDYLEFMLEEPTKARLGTMHHICLFVPDIEKAVADLESRPARKDYDRKLTIQAGTNGKRQCNLYDPDGTRVELMEPNTVDGKPTPLSTAPAPVR